jgi:hypothetical protein
MANVELIESGSPAVMQGANIISNNMNQSANRMAELASQRAQLQAQLKMEEKRAQTEEKLLELRSQKDSEQQIRSQQFAMEENRKQTQAQQDAQQKRMDFEKQMTEAANARQEKFMKAALDARTRASQLAQEKLKAGMNVRKEHAAEFEKAQKEMDDLEDSIGATTLAHKAALDTQMNLGSVIDTMLGEVAVAKQKVGDAAQGAVRDSVTNALFESSEDQPGFFQKVGHVIAGDAAVDPNKAVGWENQIGTGQTKGPMGAIGYVALKGVEGAARTILGVDAFGSPETASSNPRLLIDKVATKAAMTIVGTANGVKADSKEVATAIRNVMRAGLEVKEAAESGASTEALNKAFADRALEAKRLIGSDALDGLLRGTGAIKDMAIARNMADKSGTEGKLSKDETAKRRKTLDRVGSIADVYAAVKNDPKYGLSITPPERTIEPAVTKFLDAWARGSVDSPKLRQDFQKMGLTVDHIDKLVKMAEKRGAAPEALMAELKAMQKRQVELSRFLKKSSDSTVEGIVEGASQYDPAIQAEEAASAIYMNGAR